VLNTVEWGDDRVGRTGFAAEVEWNFRAVEPEAQVELMSSTKCYRGTAWRDRERFFVEDATDAYASRAGTIGTQVALIPRDTKWRLRELDHEEVVAGARSQSTDTDFHQIIQGAGCDGYCARGMWQAGADVGGRRYHAKGDRGAELGVRVGVRLVKRVGEA